MRFEAYIIMYLLATLFAVVHFKIKENYFFLFWLTVALGLSIVIRSTVGEEGSDIEIYIAIMSSLDWTWTPVYMREFMFWSLTRYLYSIVEDRVIVFVLLDAILFCLLFKGFNLIRIKYFINIDASNIRYIYFGLFLFFPYLIGMNGQYRQLFASAIFICALGYTVNNNLIKSTIMLAIAFLVHNVIALFIPLILLATNKLKYRFLAIVIFLFMPLLLTFSEQSDSEWITRHGIYYKATLAYAFLTFFCYLLLMIVLFDNFFRFNKKHDVFIVSLFGLVVTYIISFISLGSSLTIERIGLFIFTLLFPLLAYYLEDSLSNKKIVRVAYINISIIPIIVFYNSII